MSEQESAARQMYLKPIITAWKVVALFFDVATLMIRLLFNTLLHDTPLGKRELGGSTDVRS